MSTETAEVFFSLLTVLADVAIVVLLVARLLGVRELLEPVADLALPLAFVVAATCMGGSLYFSEVANFVPCTLCWYQRIAMYPLAIILLVATIRRDRGIRIYVVVLALIGAVISLYHYIVEWVPEAETGVCKTTVPCTLVWFRRFGFVTLPFMALTGFLLVVSLVTLRPAEDAEEAEEA
jgi:disulfide bond formation protein DsbB